MLIGSKVYVADNRGGLAVVDISTPDNPQLGNGLRTVSVGVSLKKASGNHLIATDQITGIHVYNTLSPSTVLNPTLSILFSNAEMASYSPTANVVFIVQSGRIYVLNSITSMSCVSFI